MLRTIFQIALMMFVLACLAFFFYQVGANGDESNSSPDMSDSGQPVMEVPTKTPTPIMSPVSSIPLGLIQ